MREVTLGMIQLEPKLGDVPYNRTHSIELIRHAAAKGAQIIVLPETSLTGWDAMEYSREAWYEMAEDLDGESVTQFRILAKELGVYLVVGMALRTNQPPVMENAMVFIDDEGNLGEVYNKNYLFGPEKEYFTAHDRFPVYDTRYGKVGLLCCYDANFPETSRLLTLKGAELILHCASWRREDEDVWHLMLPVRAADNVVFFASANTFGQAKHRYTFGRSKVINPRGIVVAEAGMVAEEVLVSTIDLDQVSAWRKEMLYLDDLNPALFKQLDEEMKA